MAREKKNQYKAGAVQQPLFPPHCAPWDGAQLLVICMLCQKIMYPQAECRADFMPH